MIAAADALELLREGNARFAARVSSPKTTATADVLLRLPREQHPFAIIVGCSDARVPAEIIFDQGPGDLFVVRVAGNIVAPSQIGSAEFAASQFGTRLIVVLGHSRCGAVIATLDALRQPGRASSRNLQTIVDFIRPAVEPLLGDGDGDEQTLLERAVRVNVAASVARLQRDSDILRRLAAEEGLAIVGAEYCLETGRVEFLDND